LSVGGAKVARGGKKWRLARAEVPRLGVRPGAEQLLDAFQPPRRYGQVQGGHPILVLLVEEPGLDSAAQLAQVVPRTPASAVLDPIPQGWGLPLRHPGTS